MCACSPCRPWFSIHWSTDNCSPGPLSVSYKFDDGVKITVDTVGILLDVAKSERCEMARCRAADDGREPVISVDVKEGSARDCDGGRIDRAMTTSGDSVWSNDGGGSKRGRLRRRKDIWGLSLRLYQSRKSNHSYLQHPRRLRRIQVNLSVPLALYLPVVFLSIARRACAYVPIGHSHLQCVPRRA